MTSLCSGVPRRNMTKPSHQCFMWFSTSTTWPISGDWWVVLLPRGWNHQVHSFNHSLHWLNEFLPPLTHWRKWYQTTAYHSTYRTSRGLLRKKGFTTERWSPLLTPADAEAERFKRTEEIAIRTTTTEGKNWKKEQQQFLLQYRATPNSTTGMQVNWSTWAYKRFINWGAQLSKAPKYSEATVRSKWVALIFI